MSKKINKEVYVETYVDVDVEIELDDVISFIADADEDELQAIAHNLYAQKGLTTLDELDPSTIRHLIERANIFGLEDMLDDLKREGNRIGAYLNLGESS